MVFGFADADAGGADDVAACVGDDHQFGTDQFFIQFQRQAQCAREVAGAAKEFVSRYIAAAFAHGAEAFEGFGCTDQHGTTMFAVGREIETNVHAVAAVNIDVAEAVVHYGRAGGAAETVGGFVVGVGLDLDDADKGRAVAQEAADQGRGDAEGRLPEKVRAQNLAGPLDKSL